MSSLTKVVRVGCWVISHLRFRSVPGRLKLSSTVTCHPVEIKSAAALTPRKPAPPVMRTRRPALGSGARAVRESARGEDFGSAFKVGSIRGTYLKTITRPRPHASHPYHRRVTPAERSISAPDARAI